MVAMETVIDKFSYLMNLKKDVYNKKENVIVPKKKADMFSCLM